MLKAAKTVVDNFNWIFPQSTQELRTLAWVGPYTAEAIRAFAYNESTLSFDTNLEKIFSRYYHGNKFQKLTKEEKTELLKQMRQFCNTPPVASDIPLDEGELHKASLNEGGGRRSEGVFLARDINNALMDYGATISLNNISWIDWDSYPLPSSKFYQTRWSLEPIKEKKKSSFPNKKAYVIAILHENHKVYFSKPQTTQSWILSLLEEKEAAEFKPFLIWKNTWNPRAQIQEYFSIKYWLELSVRPPEVKSYNSQEVPYMVCYCQIQSGTHEFVAHQWLKVRGFEEWYVEEMKFGENSLF